MTKQLTEKQKKRWEQSKKEYKGPDRTIKVPLKSPYKPYKRFNKDIDTT